jgi:hypothetical protein
MIALKNTELGSKFLEIVRFYCSMQFFDSYEELMSVHARYSKPIDIDDVYTYFEMHALENPSSELSLYEIQLFAHSIWQKYTPECKLLECLALVSDLASIRRHSYMETQCLVSWKWFTQLFLKLKEKAVVEGLDNSILAGIGETTMLHEILLAAKDNLLRAKQVIENGRPKLAVEKACRYTKELVGLVIILHRKLVSPIHGNQWHSAITLLFEISDIVSTFVVVLDEVRRVCGV